jgi:hypothetical protein
MPAPTRPAPIRTEPNAIAVPKGIVGYYTDLEVDALVDGLGGGGGLQTVDLSAYATTEYVDAATDEIKAMSTVAFTERYTKMEVDGLFVRKEDAVAPPSLDGYATEQYVDESVGKVAADVAALQQGVTDANAGVQSVADSITFVAGELSTQLTAKIDTKADKATTYTKAEVDEALAGAVSGQLTPAQIEEIISQVGPVDLTDYAKASDNAQAILAKVVTAQGYGFGDKNEPPAALTYTDTGEGYGERLVLAAGSSIEYVVMKSDFDPLKSRMDALESKAAPTIDAYTKTQADSKFLTLVDIDQFAYRADVYTQKQCDDRFMRIDQAFSKTDFDNQMALSLYSRKQVDDKLTAISPVGANSINDPALAEFKASMMDEVKKMMAGGKTVPADIDWTVCQSVAGSGTIEARVLNGIIQLRGEVTINVSATGSFTLVRRLPANFPKPTDSFHSIVYGIQTGSTYRRVFVRWATDGGIAICPDGTMTAATLTGATAYAY